jgi:CRP-like cAMP-binding protein
MATIKPSARRPSPNELRFPVVLRPLQDSAIEFLARQSDVLRLPRGSKVVQQPERQTHLMFLLQGQVQVEDPARDPERVDSGSTRAHFPLIAETAETAHFI